ncbi:MAG: hypothetical protein K2W82_13350 [Candidatus Obscuribacterales bacterium]|nr:hypothetical protein [Candidatus Obscuribacterales bacterium]
MIRFNKPVRVLEWGQGTNTQNQIWTPLAEGRFVKRVAKDGVTTLTVQTNSAVSKKNEESMAVKLAQVGEGVTANSERWGEVASGNIKNIEGNTLVIEIPYATKISGAAGLIARFFGLP